jgi:hypothetical protein
MDIELTKNQEKMAIDAWKNNKGTTLKISEHHYNDYAENHTPQLNKKNEAKVKKSYKEQQYRQYSHVK